MTEEEKIALFDAYLANELALEDRADFERMLETNEAFNDEFMAYSLFSSQIAEGGEYKNIRHKLEDIHGNLYGEKRQHKPLLLKPAFYIPLGIAAGIVLLITIVKPFSNVQNGDTAAHDVEYHELENNESAVEEISDGADDQHEENPFIREAIDTDSLESHLDKMLPIVNSTPKGSCFMISNDGFFITSKHLVEDKRIVKIQQKDRGIAFNAEVVYRDSLLDFAILRCAKKQTDDFKAVPFKVYRKKPALGEDVFTLGYPKPDIVYTEGVVSSETGFRSDSVSFEVSMPANPGNSGAPLFTANGDLVGMVIANNSKKQSVTYILKPYYIQERLDSLRDSLQIDMSTNYTKRYSRLTDMIEKYRQFIFEIL